LSEKLTFRIFTKKRKKGVVRAQFAHIVYVLSGLCVAYHYALRPLPPWGGDPPLQSGVRSLGPLPPRGGTPPLSRP
jgi:hypothetical protein